MIVNTEITGLKELRKNVDGLKKSFARTTLRTALRNAAKPVVKEAKALVPVDSGDLKRSIRSTAKVSKAGDGYADVGFDRKQFHGQFVELGTSQQASPPLPAPRAGEGTPERCRCIRPLLMR